MQKCAEVDYWINDLQPQSPLPNNLQKQMKLQTLYFFPLWSFMACGMYKLEQTVLMAQLLNLLIWAWELHKANISYYIVSQSM